MTGDYYGADDSRQAKAITWEEYRRGGGGGGGGDFDPREPTWLGRIFRDWACKLISHENNSLENKEAKTPTDYVAARQKQKELTKEFNRISDEPGIGATLAAVRTVFRYNFGLTEPAQG